MVQLNHETENLWADRRRQTGRKGCLVRSTAWPMLIYSDSQNSPGPQHFPGTSENSTRSSSLSSRDEGSPRLNSSRMFPTHYLPMEGIHLFILKEKKIDPLLMFLLNKMSFSPEAAFRQHVNMDGRKLMASMDVRVSALKL